MQRSQFPLPILKDSTRHSPLKENASRFGLALVLIVTGAVDGLADELGPESLRQFQEVFASADEFVAGDGEYPHYRAYRSDPEAEQELLGFVFYTTAVVPDEWAYSGNIDMLVGITTAGVITGTLVVDHTEPFGYFSIDPPEFADQFTGKSILDPLKEGVDIDSITTATITVDGAARVVRKAARRVARQHLRQAKQE